MIKSKEPPLDEVRCIFCESYPITTRNKATVGKQVAANAPALRETSLGSGGATMNLFTRTLLQAILAPCVALLLFMLLSSPLLTTPRWPPVKHHMVTSPQSIFRSVTGAFTEPGARDVTAGASVLLDSTSVTTQIQPYRFDQQLFRWTMRKKAVIPVPPEAVLDESAAGWCFPGSTGYIALKLLHPVYVSNVTVSHSLTDPRSAPNNLVIWAIVPRSHAEHLGSMVLETKAASQLPASLQTSQTTFPIAIAIFQFDVQKSVQNQTFEVDSVFTKASVKVDRVLVQILSNWGAGSTCLYGVKIYGS
jgi:hypothetical protein